MYCIEYLLDKPNLKHGTFEILVLLNAVISEGMPSLRSDIHCSDWSQPLLVLALFYFCVFVCLMLGMYIKCIGL